MQGFHLDAGAIDRFDRRLDGDVVVTDFETDRDGADQQRVAERDHVGGPFGCLDCSHSGDRQHITFLDLPIRNRFGRLGLHENLGPSDGSTMGGFLRRDIDHPGMPERVEVRELEIIHEDSTVAAHRCTGPVSTTSKFDPEIDLS